MAAGPASVFVWLSGSKPALAPRPHVCMHVAAGVDFWLSKAEDFEGQWPELEPSFFFQWAACRNDEAHQPQARCPTGSTNVVSSRSPCSVDENCTLSQLLSPPVQCRDDLRMFLGDLHISITSVMPPGWWYQAYWNQLNPKTRLKLIELVVHWCYIVLCYQDQILFCLFLWKNQLSLELHLTTLPINTRMDLKICYCTLQFVSIILNCFIWRCCAGKNGIGKRHWAMSSIKKMLRLSSGYMHLILYIARQWFPNDILRNSWVK